MRIPDETRDQLSVKLAVLLPHPDERQRRLLLAAEARVLGHGGVRAVARAAAVSETTVRRACSSRRPARPRWGGYTVTGAPAWRDFAPPTPPPGDTTNRMCPSARYAQETGGSPSR